MLKQARESYFKCSRSIRQNLATSYGILLSMCDDGLRSLVGTESEIHDMIKRKKICVMKLYRLIRKACNGPT